MPEQNFTEAQKEGKRIAREYLSKLGWARAAGRGEIRKIVPAWTREEKEDVFRNSDQMLEDAEELFGQEVDRYRKENTPFAKEVLRTVFDQLKNRSDLGFFAKRMIGRLKEDLWRDGDPKASIQ